MPIFLKWGVDWLQRRGELLRTADQKQGVVIVGARPAARTLATALSASDSVWLMDNNKDRCERAQAEGLNAVHGDALDAEDLQKAQIGEAGWFFALTGNTETNILAAQLARNTFSVPEIHVLLTGTEKGSLLHLLAEIGAHPIHDNTIHFTTLNKLMNADDTTVETVDIDVKSSLPTKSFMSTNQQDFRIFVPLTVLRNGHTLPFLAQEMLEAGDTVKAAVLT
ncbi:MAG: NAD(P)-binding protein [Anaerolineae bacterium]